MTAYLVESGKVLFVLIVLLSTVPVLIWAERKVAAGIQQRIGPNRVGPFGILQPLADTVKLMFKEDIVPAKADKFLFNLGPVLAFIPPCLVFAVIPFGYRLTIDNYTTELQVSSIGLGIVLFMCLVSISVYGVVFGAWASNNKYALLGGLRATAQLISYELILTLSLVSIIMLSETLNLQKIVLQQSTGLWNILNQPLAALLFLIAAMAENKRLPFDLPESEQELVGGYHTEYSGIKFALFFGGEYISIVSMSALFVTVFLGGWSLPGLDLSAPVFINALVGFIIFALKTSFIIFAYMWIRWTLPRFKYNNLMRLSWKYLLPLALFNIVLTGIILV